ncbi:P-loop containing nucleoside triphosphate hydrolase protein [Mycena albidolilacea]|uniref:P-loop containing nucleoside triphosphate hydrolase protein n=1 Tax=Mycena albidolilacea TaxID=1033008 RepID=A0AAD6ZEX4_9AGAR|nr:P-loop containing nucleoside triphosphate hydrolase protein [Mycena albidolilacea]
MTLVQQFLSDFTTQLNTANATTAASATVAPPMPTDPSSLLVLLSSFTALRDWMRLAFLGGLIEMCRRFVFGGYAQMVNSFYITACFEEQDVSYTWMMVWLSKQPSWSKVRNVQVSTNTLINNTAIILDGDDEMRSKSSRKLAFLPSLSTTYNLWYKRRWMTITRSQNQTGWYGSKEQTLYVSIMTRDHSVLVSLLQEARRDYLAAQEHKMCVYVSDTSNNWCHVACREKRSMNSIILDPGVKDILIDDAKDFLLSKEWYAERGIPHRRGYLLYGAPGSGKTSFIHAAAGEIGLDVYIISLSRIGLDDSALSELVNALPGRCVALMEDIDAAFTSGLNRDAAATTVDSPDANACRPRPGAPAPLPTSRLSLSGLLNALDGVGAQEGRILFATTNKYSVLDAALCRPGRMDLHIEFKLASKLQAGQLFSRFYLPAHNLDTMRLDGEEGEEGSVDSGYHSTGCEDGDEKIPPSPAESSSMSTSTDVPEGEKPVYNGTSHQTRAPQLKRRQIANLAVRFSETIPEREISMASLQGYLMAYKTRPFAAVANAKAWVEKERSDKVAKACKETEVDAGNVNTADLAKENEAEKAKALTAEKENGKETGSENLKETS